MISARARTIVIAVVTAVWAMNFIAGVFIHGYQPSESINGIFMGIVGGLFALGARNGDGGNGGSGGGAGGSGPSNTTQPTPPPDVQSTGTAPPPLPTSGDDEP